MKQQKIKTADFFRKVTTILIIVYVISWFGLFYFSVFFMYPFIFLPGLILLLVCFFGTHLGVLSDKILRGASCLLLLGGLYQANQYICCSGEQGAVGVPFVVMMVMILFLILYGFLCLLHVLKKA